MEKNEYIEQLFSLMTLPYVVWSDPKREEQDDAAIPESIYEKMAEFYLRFDFETILRSRQLYQVESDFGLCDLLIPGDGRIYVVGPYLKERGSTAEFFFQLINNDLPISHELNLFYHSLPVFKQERRDTLFQLLCRELDLSDICEIKQDKMSPTENHLHTQIFLWKNAEEALSALMSAEGQLMTAMELVNWERMAEAERQLQDTVQQLNYRFELQYLKEHLQISNSSYQRLCSIKTSQFNQIDTLYYDFRNRIRELDSQEAAFALQKEMYQAYSRLLCTHSYEGYPVLVQQTLRYLNEHWRQKPTLAEIADTLSVNKTYLSSLFNRYTGQSISQYLNDLKINWAEMLVRSTSLSISDVAYLCGFGDASYFGKVYKKRKGHTALESRASRESDMQNK